MFRPIANVTPVPIAGINMSNGSSRSPIANAPQMTVRFADHLFIAGDTNKINEQHQGLVNITDEVKTAWTEIVLGREDRLRRSGCDFVFVLAPDKQTIYRHILPDTYRFRQSDFLSSINCVVDPAPILSTISKLIDVYPHTDSHWNHLGALLTTQLIQTSRRSSMPELSIDWTEPMRPGDLGNKFTPPEHSKFLSARIRSKAAMIYDNLIPNNGRIRIFSKDLGSARPSVSKLVMVGDSFSYNLVHFLKEMFDVVCHVHAFSVDYRLIDKIKPDLVIAEITERFLLRAPSPKDGEPLTQLWEEKRASKSKLEPSLGLTIYKADHFPSAVTEIISYVEELFAPFTSYFRANITEEFRA
jgi:alginate O-acetyltransferase complex protein AlgJ